MVGTKVYKPLPPPSERSVLLRSKGLEFIESWCEKYGHANKQVLSFSSTLENVADSLCDLGAAQDGPPLPQTLAQDEVP